MIIDITFILIILFFTIYGLKKGFIIEILSLLSIVISIYLVPKSLKHFVDFFNIEIKNKYIAYLIAFICIYILISILFGLINSLLDKSSFGFLNKLLGATLGFVKSSIIVFVLFIILLFASDKSKRIKTELNESFTVKYISIYLNRYNQLFPEFIRKRLDKFRKEKIIKDYMHKILKDFEKGEF